MTIYQFQCNRCFIVSGRLSQHSNDAPACCGGEYMVPIPIANIKPEDLYQPQDSTILHKKNKKDVLNERNFIC